MRVLGIDPGSTVTGLGVVTSSRGRLRLVHMSCVRTDASDPMPERLAAIYAGITAVLREAKPDVVAIEAIFRHRSSESALKLGQARGVALLAAATAGLPVFEYNASTVKKCVGAHGHADKGAVARMVQMLLGTTVSGPLDVSDALAIAITHCAHARTAGRIAS